MSYQRGSLKKLPRKGGETWVLRYRVTKADGRRVEHTMPVALVRDFPKQKDAWREVDKLGLLLRINDDPGDVRIRFNALAEHYLKADFGDRCRASEVGKHHHHHQAHRPRLSRFPMGQRDRRGHQTSRHSVLVQVASCRLWTCLDDDLQDARCHEPHLQGRDAARQGQQESCAECRDTGQNQLQTHCYYARSNVRDSQIFSEPPSFHACPHLRSNGTPVLEDSGAALGRHSLE